jgi:hypothetical protein
VSRIERNGRRISLRRPKRSAIKEGSAPGKRGNNLLWYTNTFLSTKFYEF